MAKIASNIDPRYKLAVAIILAARKSGLRELIISPKEKSE